MKDQRAGGRQPIRGSFKEVLLAPVPGLGENLIHVSWELDMTRKWMHLPKPVGMKINRESKLSSASGIWEEKSVS